MMRIFLLLSLLSLSLAQNWTQTIVVAELPQKILFQTHFVDLSNNYVHFLYAVQTSRIMVTLFYRRLYPNGSVTEPITLLPGLKHYASSDITGAHDGRRIFIAACTKRNPESDWTDVFFIESKDGGNNFSTPVAVPRKEMNDEANRISPRVRFSLEHERLWLVYYRVINSQKYIAFVSRPKGSAVFSSEQVAARDINPTDQLRFELAYSSKGATTLVLAYRSRSYGNYIIAFVSTNFGIDWNSREYNTGDGITSGSEIDLAMNEEISDNYIVSSLHHTSDIDYVAYDGPMWEGKIESDVRQLPTMLSTSLCKMDVGYLYAAFTTGDGDNVVRTKGAFMVKDPSTKVGKLYVSPFMMDNVEHVYYPRLSCWYTYEAKGNFVVSAVGVKADGRYNLLASKSKIIPLKNTMEVA